MKLYTVYWREPGYGIDIWTLDRNLYQDKQRALNLAYTIAQNHWDLDAFPADCIGEYNDGIALFRRDSKGSRVIGEYRVIEFDFNDL